MSIFGCLLGHKWEARAVHHYTLTYKNAPGCAMASTKVTFMCARCSELKAEDMKEAGHLTLDQLRPAVDLEASAAEKAKAALVRMRGKL